MWAVVGLGNPGREYTNTRHNAGFLFIRRLAKEWQVKLRRRIFLSKAGVAKRGNDQVLLAMPQTYMNNSGLAVKRMIEGTWVVPHQLVVVYDDLDIPLGEIRIRKEGGAGNHKGMRSIIKEIQTTKFPRIRIGIGPLPYEEEAASFVLSPLEPEEKSKLELSFARAQQALDLILKGNIERAMTLYNKRNKSLLVKNKRAAAEK